MVSMGSSISSGAKGPEHSKTRADLGSQTLRRGLDVLQVVIDAERPLSITEIATLASLNRSVTYRLLRTLEDRGLVTQGEGQGFQAGLGLLRLMPRLRENLIAHARPVLAELARSTRATVILSLRDREHLVCLLCVTPPGDGPFITFREGSDTPLGLGAASLALLALREPRPDERPEVTQAREQNPLAVVRTSGELRPGTTGLALAWQGQPDLAVSIVFFDGTLQEDDAEENLRRAGRQLAHHAGH